MTRKPICRDDSGPLYHRSGHCKLWNSYKKRLNQTDYSSCPDCGMDPQDISHLFKCTAHPTALTPENVWDRPGLTAVECLNAKVVVLIVVLDDTYMIIFPLFSITSWYRLRIFPLFPNTSWYIHDNFSVVSYHLMVQISESSRYFLSLHGTD